MLWVFRGIKQQDLRGKKRQGKKIQLGVYFQHQCFTPSKNEVMDVWYSKNEFYIQKNDIQRIKWLARQRKEQMVNTDLTVTCRNIAKWEL